MRSFLAVAVREPALGPAVRLLDELAAAIPRRECRWVRAGGLHLTLHFFGELAEERVGEVLELLTPAARAAEPFSLTLGGLGSFPPRGEPRVLWLGAVAGREPLAALAGDCRGRLSAAGFAVEERRFSPHCTLGRPRPGWSLAARSAWAAAVAAGVELPRCDVDRLTLYRTDRLPSGSEYSVVAEVPLGHG